MTPVKWARFQIELGLFFLPLVLLTTYKTTAFYRLLVAQEMP